MSLSNSSSSSSSSSLNLLSLPTDLLHRIASFLPARDAIHVAASCRCLYSNLSLSILPPRTFFPRQYLAGHAVKGDEPTELIVVPLQYVQGATSSDSSQPARRIHSIIIEFDWYDQGWGNRKGQVYVMTRPSKQSNHRRHATPAPYDGGRVVYESPLAEHQPSKLRIELPPPESADEEYSLWTKVGGGGGHLLFLNDGTIRTLLYDDVERNFSRNYHKLYECGVLKARWDIPSSPPSPSSREQQSSSASRSTNQTNTTTPDFYHKLLVETCHMMRRQLALQQRQEHHNGSAPSTTFLDESMMAFFEDYGIVVTENSLLAVIGILQGEWAAREQLQDDRQARLEASAAADRAPPPHEQGHGGPGFFFQLGIPPPFMQVNRRDAAAAADNNNNNADGDENHPNVQIFGAGWAGIQFGEEGEEEDEDMPPLIPRPPLPPDQANPPQAPPNAVPEQNERGQRPFQHRIIMGPLGIPIPIPIPALAVQRQQVQQRRQQQAQQQQQQQAPQQNQPAPQQAPQQNQPAPPPRAVQQDQPAQEQDQPQQEQQPQPRVVRPQIQVMRPGREAPQPEGPPRQQQQQQQQQPPQGEGQGNGPPLPRPMFRHHVVMAPGQFGMGAGGMPFPIPNPAELLRQVQEADGLPPDFLEHLQQHNEEMQQHMHRIIVQAGQGGGPPEVQIRIHAGPRPPPPPNGNNVAPGGPNVPLN